MTTLLLARHGETDWNRRGIWQGHADPPLNDLGRAQAGELAERLAGAAVDAIHSSDLRRALQRHMLGDPLPVLENGGVYGVRFEDGRFRPID